MPRTRKQTQQADGTVSTAARAAAAKTTTRATKKVTNTNRKDNTNVSIPVRSTRRTTRAQSSLAIHKDDSTSTPQPTGAASLKRPLAALKDTTNKTRRVPLSKRKKVNKSDASSDISSLSSKQQQQQENVNNDVASGVNSNSSKGSMKTNRSKEAASVSNNTTVPSHVSVAAITPTSAMTKLHQLPFQGEAKEQDDSVSSEPPALPDGVVNLYPNNSQIQQQSCCPCSDDHCTAESLMGSYLSNYGWEFREQVRQMEECCVQGTATRIQQHRRSSTASASSIAVRNIYSNSSARRFISPGSEENHELMKEDDFMARQPELSPQMRSILVDWIFELSEEYDLSPTTVHLAVTLIDRSLACGPGPDNDDDSADGDDDNENSRDSCSTKSSGFSSSTADSHTGNKKNKNRPLLIERDMLQCLGCACTWIACKIEELKAPSVRDFVYISDNIYSSDQIRKLELKVCSALSFDLWQITPVHYVHEFLRASHGCSNNPSSYSGCCQRIPDRLQFMVLYLLELSRIPYELATKSPRLLAAASVYLARATLGIRDTSCGTNDGCNEFWTPTLRHYTGYSVAELKESVTALHEVQFGIENSDQQAVFVKYKAPKYLRVSHKTVPNTADLGF